MGLPCYVLPTDPSRRSCRYGNVTARAYGWNGGTFHPREADMAYFPCEHCGARYRGPQQTAYPALVSGVTSHREKKRLCPECFASLDAWCTNHLVDTQGSSGLMPFDGMACGLCGSEDPLAWSAFVTLYPRGEPRRDLWGRVCADCTDPATVALFAQHSLPTA